MKKINNGSDYKIDRGNFIMDMEDDYKKTKAYKTWVSMFSRCYNRNVHNYKNYGQRGIKVCERWWKFSNFYNDMGERPLDKDSIERINNNGDYCPENCKWATRKEQAQNSRRKGYTYIKKRNCYQVFIQIDGKQKSCGYFINVEDAKAAYIEAKVRRKLGLDVIDLSF